MKKYKTDFSEDELKGALHSNDEKAKELLENPDKWIAFKMKIENFVHTAYKIPVLGGLVDDIISMIQIVDAFVKNEYREVPWPTMLSIVAALIYVLSPIDIIPDAIPVIGYFDDAAVVMLVLKLGAGHDLEKFKKWQEEERDMEVTNLARMLGNIIKETLKNDLLGTIIVSENNKFRILAIEDCFDKEDIPYECKVYYLNTPINMLRDMYIEDERDIISFFNRVLDVNDFNWSPLGRLDAIHESKLDRYEDYFSLMEDKDVYE